MKEGPELCKKGFHFCPMAADCFGYYGFDPKNKVAEVEALGDIDGDGDKRCTNKLRVVREIPWPELLEMVNTGRNNTGIRNTGNWNTGSRNTGSRNTGDRNTGHWNTGDWNTADNTGGCFCTEKHTIRFFDEESGLTLDDWRDHPARIVLLTAPPSLKWIGADEMTEEEKAGNPSYETTGGYLKKLDIRAIRKERQAWWDKLPPEDQEKVYGIPNFDQEKFERIMKIKVGDRDA